MNLRIIEQYIEKYVEYKEIGIRSSERLYTLAEIIDNLHNCIMDELKEPELTPNDIGFIKGRMASTYAIISEYIETINSMDVEG